METTGIAGVILGLYRGFNLGIMGEKLETNIIGHTGGIMGTLAWIATEIARIILVIHSFLPDRSALKT